MDIYNFLNEQQICYEYCAHPPVFTCEEAERLVPNLSGAKTKNLFLRNKKGDRHFLLTVHHNKDIDLKQLAATLGCGGLSMASPERLKDYLGLQPGSVSLLALINDSGGAVEVLLDEDLRAAEALQCHPLVNTSTLVLSLEDLERFINCTGHSVNFVCVPERPNARR
jgi:Ala-tRNA(Pro) deacylase